MCRWLAYRGKGIYLDELLYKPERSLVHQSLEAAKAVTAVNADGFGLCWYDNRDFPGTYHEVLPAWSDQNLRSLAHHINSHCFMAHVRASTGANTSRTNCHPFVYRDWAFMHNGQIGEFERVRYRLERSLPETLFLEKKGQTDSELIFLLMLKNGLTENPYEAMNQTVREIELAMQERGVKELQSINVYQRWGMLLGDEVQLPCLSATITLLLRVG